MVYYEMIQSAVDYIDSRLTEEIFIEDVAKTAYLSVPHLYRIFPIMAGCTVGQYIRMRRLSCSVLELKRTHRKIIDIAVNFQFESQESYIHAFKELFGITPGRYRKFQGIIALYNPLRLNPLQKKGGMTMQPRIMKKRILLAGIEAEIDLSVDFSQIINTLRNRLRNEADFITNKVLPLRMYGVWSPVSGDEKNESSSKRSYFAGVEVDNDFMVPAGLLVKDLPESLFACFREKTRGTMSRYAYTEWLPASGYILNIDAIPGDIEIFDDMDHDDVNDECDILLPIRTPENDDSITTDKKYKKDRYAVKYFNGVKYIDGVPMLKWGKWQDNTYCGSIAAVAEILNIPTSYEHLMGVSGLCYRFAMKPDWCPSSALAQNGSVFDESIKSFIGKDMYGITDETERNDNVKKNIGAGVPVICLGQIGSPEWGIITGYSEDGDVFFGRSYFDPQNIIVSQQYYQADNVYFTENNYRHAKNYPGFYPEGFLKFFDKDYTKNTPIKSLKKSLESCVQYYNHNEFNGCRFGRAAFDVLIDGFRKDDGEYDCLCQNANYHLGVLVDARRCAHVYLDESAALLSGEKQNSLREISAMYKTIYDSILSVVPYQMLSEEFAFGGSTKEPWNFDIRKELADTILRTEDMEAQILIIVKDILDKWDRT